MYRVSMSLTGLPFSLPLLKGTPAGGEASAHTILLLLRSVLFYSGKRVCVISEKEPPDVTIASDADREAWDRFVDREGGSFFLYYDWKSVYEFKNQNRFLPLLIRDSNSAITGIFPLVEQKASRIYPWLSSLPEGPTGGFLLSRSLDEEEKKQNLRLFFSFIEKTYSRTHSLITLNEQIPPEQGSPAPTPALLENGYTWSDNASSRLPCTHYLKLEQPFEEKIWKARWSGKLRQQVRHARKNGAEVLIDDKFAYLDDFLEMQLHTNKKFGGGIDRDRIVHLFAVFQKRIQLFIGFLDAQPISAALCFYTPTTAYLSKAPYLPVARKHDTNTLPVCSSIEYACNASYRYYEMGVTTTPDLASYKEKFGAVRMPLRRYTKKLSYFKFFMNKTYGFIMD